MLMNSDEYLEEWDMESPLAYVGHLGLTYGYHSESGYFPN